MGGSPEVIKGGVEASAEAQRAAGERSAELAKNRSEKGAESSPESQVEAIEKARGDAKEALMSKERGGAENKAGGEPTGAAIRRVTKQQKNQEYKKTLAEIQSKMNSPARAFSKVIHNPAVEKASDLVGSTIARPTAILTGSTVAFIAVAAVYVTARYYGYVLSGFETIGAFIMGWLFGVMIDYLRVLLRGGGK